MPSHGLGTPSCQRGLSPEIFKAPLQRGPLQRWPMSTPPRGSSPQGTSLLLLGGEAAVTQVRVTKGCQVTARLDHDYDNSPPRPRFWSAHTLDRLAASWCPAGRDFGRLAGMTGPGAVWALPDSGATRLPSCLSRAPSPGLQVKHRTPGACAFYTGNEYFLV